MEFQRLDSLMKLPMILTSGTLHPLETFEQELGLPFPIKLCNQHVVAEDNVFVRVIKNGMVKPVALKGNVHGVSTNTSVQLDCSFKNRSNLT